MMLLLIPPTIIYIFSVLTIKVLPVVFLKHITSDFKNVYGKVWPKMTILREKKLALPEIKTFYEAL